MDVAVHRDARASEGLATEWRALWGSDPHASLFHTPDYAGAWWHAFGNGVDVAVVEARRDAALAGVASAVIERGTLRFFGDAEITDYLGPVCAPADRDAASEAFVQAAGGLGGWRTAVLEGLAADSGWPEALARAAKAAGLGVEEEQQDVCPRVLIPGSYEGYLDALDAKSRHEIRRKARRLERVAGPYAVRVSGRSTLDRDLERFYQMHRSSEGHKGRFMHWGMEGMFKLVARAFLDRGWLRLTWLEVGGEPYASVFSFSDGRGTWSVYNSAYDSSKGGLAPGMVLMAENLRLAAEEGCGTVDLLRGSEPYKYRLGAVDVPLVRLTARRA